MVERFTVYPGVTYHTLARRVEGLRNELIDKAVQQPTTNDRDAFADGFAGGLLYAVDRLAAIRERATITNGDTRVDD